MALRAKVLQKKAEKFELKKLLVVEVTKEGVSTLDTLLQDVYATRRPKAPDYEARKDLIRVFNEIAKELYGTSKDIPVVVEFGSFVMDLFSTTSDLDLSVNFSASGVEFPREKKIQTLRKFARKLYAIQSLGHVSGVLPITSAKVPILKCVDRGTGVECDISVENRDGISKSQIIGIIASIDERFKKLSFLMKTWAKAHNINSSKDKTLNSLSIILLVAFHLQINCCARSVWELVTVFKNCLVESCQSNCSLLFLYYRLPKRLLNSYNLDGTNPAMVAKSMSNFANYGKGNRESLAELFITLLLKLSSVEKLWPKGLCASTYDASWTSKTWNSKVACISVEDFTDQSQNVARVVGPAEAKQIYKCIDTSIRNIASFMGGQLGVQLKDLLFGVDGGIPTSIPRGVKNLNRVSSQANRTRGKLGKRKRAQLQSGSIHKKRIIHVAQPGNGKQVQQPLLVETSLAKRARTDEGWTGMGDGRYAGGWEQSRAQGWEETCNVRGGGWGVSRQNICGDWGAMLHQGGGWEGGNHHQQQQHISRGWGGEVREGGNQQQQHGSRGWGGGGWEGTQHVSRGWGVGVREGGNQQQQHGSRGWGGGGWEGTQQPNVGVWGWGGNQQG